MFYRLGNRFLSGQEHGAVSRSKKQLQGVYQELDLDTAVIQATSSTTAVQNHEGSSFTNELQTKRNIIKKRQQQN